MSETDTKDVNSIALGQIDVSEPGILATIHGGLGLPACGRSHRCTTAQIPLSAPTGRSRLMA